MKLFSRLLFSVTLGLALLTFVPLVASSNGDSSPVIASLLSEEDAIRPGRPFWVGVQLKIAQGWDTYWQNPGDVGFPTQVAWHLPEGFAVGDLEWPCPQRFSNESLIGYGYTDTVLLMAEVTPPSALAIGQKVKIEADVCWLACSASCVPGSAKLSLVLPVTETDPSVNQSVSDYFTVVRENLPKPMEGGNLTAQAAENKIILKFEPAKGQFGNVVEAMFFPQEGGIDHGAPQTLKAESQGFTLALQLAEGESPSTIKGVLLVSEKETGVKRAIIVDTTLDRTSKAVDGVSSVWIALGLACVGGMILNVMPCVLPVIALKIFSFVKMAGEKRSLIFKQGALYSFGVILSFWCLSGALLVLRAYGQGVGWGFQLQEPVFVVILAIILFLLGLSLFGVFEFGTSMISLGQKASNKPLSPLMSSFWSGVLATLVATPCTGPLLGPALGFAMTLPPLLTLLIFTAMGFGMASPYLLLAAFPKLVRFLPKPGNWMLIFKQLMGFLMMTTVAWLVWVFGAQTDNMAVFGLLMALIVLAMGAWIFGQWATPVKKRVVRYAATMIALMVVLVGGGFAIHTAKIHKEMYSDSEQTVNVGYAGWEAYSPERVRELRAEGHPVFIDFTAKWCLICQTNKVALHSRESEIAFEKAGVVKMIADWTRKDQQISNQLDQLGRTGVPVYVLYPADPSAEPLILPQTLTTSVITDYISQLNVN
ncbi:MAG: thioredoxin family protein [Chlamydiia bacterium]|nr:thioredoxin family protein [Chlamydiia bacterium]